MAKKAAKPSVVKITALKPAVSIVEPKKTADTLETEVESRETDRENGFIMARAHQGNTPTLRQAAPGAPLPSQPVPARQFQQSPDARPEGYTPRTDAEVYTALSSQNAATRYTVMHGDAKADDRIATRARVTASAPPLGSRAGTIPAERFVGQQGLNQQEPFTLRSAWQDDRLDRRYDMYREDSLQDANKPRRARR